MKEVLKFESKTCAGCKRMQPTLKKLCEEKGIQLTCVDVEEQGQLAMQYQVRSVPTVVLLEDEEEVHRIIGAVNKGELEQFLSGSED